MKPSRNISLLLLLCFCLPGQAAMLTLAAGDRLEVRFSAQDNTLFGTSLDFLDLRYDIQALNGDGQPTGGSAPANFHFSDADTSLYSGFLLPKFYASDSAIGWNGGEALNFSRIRDGSFEARFRIELLSDARVDTEAFDLFLGTIQPPVGPFQQQATRSGQQPVLVSVSQVPLPAAVWLFGASLLALSGVARRR